MARFLGGRKEVLGMPLDEGLVFMQLQLEEQQREAYRKRELFWMDFLSKIYSAPVQKGMSEDFLAARERYISAIRPFEVKPKEYEWDIPKEIMEEAERKYMNSGHVIEYATEEVEKGGS